MSRSSYNLVLFLCSTVLGACTVVTISPNEPGTLADATPSLQPDSTPDHPFETQPNPGDAMLLHEETSFLQEASTGDTVETDSGFVPETTVDTAQQPETEASVEDAAPIGLLDSQPDNNESSDGATDSISDGMPGNPIQVIEAPMTQGESHSCALVQGNVHCWGDNASGKLGFGYLIPQSISLPAGSIDFGQGKTAKKVKAGANHTCAILNDDTVRCWGENTNYQLGDGTALTRSAPIAVNFGPGITVKDIALGRWHSCAILSDGSVRCWGNNGNGQLGITNSTGALLVITQHSPVAPAFLGLGRKAVKIEAGNTHTCVLLNDGKIRCWGFNADGQLGLSGSGNNIGDVPLATSSPIRGLSLGSNHSCVSVESGSIYCWGNNSFGQLGFTSSAAVSIPTKVPSINNAAQVSAARSHTCALLTDNKLWCWGLNEDGELGVGDRENSEIPRPLLLSSVSALSTGYSHSCALSKGKLYCWGYNHRGQLGIGNILSSTTPKQVSGLSFL